MNVTISITGAKELDALLSEMPGQFQHKFLQQVHADAAQLIVLREHRLAPVKSGKTADSIGIIKPAFAKATLVGEVQVGPRRGRYGGNVAHLNEFGTRTRGRYGVMPAKPFVAPAWEQEQRPAEDQIVTSLSIRLDRYLRRMVKGGLRG